MQCDHGDAKDNPVAFINNCSLNVSSSLTNVNGDSATKIWSNLNSFNTSDPLNNKHVAT